MGFIILKNEAERNYLENSDPGNVKNELSCLRENTKGMTNLLFHKEFIQDERKPDAIP